MIRTISLKANTEQKINIDKYHVKVTNFTDGNVYISEKANVVAGKDNVKVILSGQADGLTGVYDDYFFIKSDSNGNVQIETADNMSSFFKSNIMKGGGSGEVTDTYTKEEINTKLANKVSIEPDKQLSTNDFDNTYKDKLDGIEDNAEVNIQSDWNTSDTGNKAFIKNKPNIYTKIETDNLLKDKVSKETGKGLIATSEVERLANVDNYDDTAIKIDINKKVDKVSGKGLSSNDYTDTEKSKLAKLSNYNDTEIKEKIAINQSSTGISKKNLLPYNTKSTSNFKWDNDGYISAIQTSSDSRQWTVGNSQYGVKLKAGTYTLSFLSKTICSSAYGDIFVMDSSGNKILNIGQQNYYNKSSGSKSFTLDSEQTIYIMIKCFDGQTGIMIRNADISDDTYEPYTDDLQTQINNLISQLKEKGVL